MPEEPKDFPQSGADGSGQIGKQDWELPNSVSAPPDGFPPNVETASYGGYDESITDYHPPVEQGETLHPFKVTRFRDEYDTPKIRVRVGRFYYSAQVSKYTKILEHGPHNMMGTSTLNEVDSHDHTVTNTNTTADLGGNMIPHGSSQTSGTAVAHWPINEGSTGAGHLHPESWFCLTSTTGNAFPHAGMESSANNKTDSIPYNFRFEDPDNFGVWTDYNDYIEFDATEGVSTVWLRYIINANDNEFTLFNMDNLSIHYTQGVNRPTTHGELGQLSMEEVTTGVGTQVTHELVRANGANWAQGWPSGATAGPNQYAAGCYYIRIAEIAAEGDEDSRPITQYVEDNIFAPHHFEANSTYKKCPSFGEAAP
tara:strand:+ start:1589 stop:2692 length:1104 start_codon:yes stop_codon:yes gene_type:complete